jgi:hypothetical protein
VEYTIILSPGRGHYLQHELLFHTAFNVKKSSSGLQKFFKKDDVFVILFIRRVDIDFIKLTA